MVRINHEATHDVVVVGGGIIGLACAWRSAQAGMSTLVVDRGESAAGPASAVAAGMLAPVTEATFGEHELLRLNLAARAAWPGFAAELAERSGVDVGYSESGALVVAADGGGRALRTALSIVLFAVPLLAILTRYAVAPLPPVARDEAHEDVGPD